MCLLEHTSLGCVPGVDLRFAYVQTEQTRTRFPGCAGGHSHRPWERGKDTETMRTEGWEEGVPTELES